MLRYCLAALFFFPVLAVSGQGLSEVWVSDQGDGTYVNPIIHADYSDPDAIAVGADFYMTASSFNCSPGLPILHSRDLVNWTIESYALERAPLSPAFESPQHGRGVWAPCLRYHDDTFYIYWGDPDQGIFMVCANDPLGKWSEPVLVKAGKGMIDPTPLWDDDGRAYLAYAWAGSRAGINSVVSVCEMNPDGTRVVGKPVMVFDGNMTGNHTVEGPKLYQRNGYYYILAPAGGVENGWQLALRSASVYGPYEARVVMAQGETDINGPHQGAWVETEEGESWFIHFQDKGAYGRVIHLNPMTWKDDWPIIGEPMADNPSCGTPVARHQKPKVKADSQRQTPAESDEFNSTEWGLQWQWEDNYQDLFGFTTQDGYVRLYGHWLSSEKANLWEVPNLLLQKFPAPEFTATAKVRVTAKEDGQASGLVVMGLDYCRLSVVKNGEQFSVQLIECHDAEHGAKETLLAEAPLKGGRKYEAGALPNYEVEAYLRVNVAAGAVCSFSYSVDGKKFYPIGSDFTARPGKWIGAKVGLFSISPKGDTRGWMDADWFRITHEK